MRPTLTVGTDYIDALTFSPYNNSLAVISRNSETSDSTLIFWDYRGSDTTEIVDSGKNIPPYENAVAFTTDGTRVAYFMDGAIRLYDLEARTPSDLLEIPPRNIVNTLAFGAENTLLAVGLRGFTDEQVVIFDVKTGSILCNLSGSSVIFSDDKRLLLTSSRNGLTYVWGVPSTEE